MTFAHPEWLLGLIFIPILAGVAWLTWHKRGTRWRQLVAPRLQGRLTRTRPAWIYFTSLGLALAGWGGLVIAMAQPESGEEWVEVDNEGRNILFCIDISKSMLVEDIAPSRLLASRAAALEILERFPYDRVGVLLFSGGTLVQSPLTLDHAFVEQTLAQLTPGDIPLGGSDLDQAIKSGTRLLTDTGQQTNIMVVFSDGEKSSEGLKEAAKEAADAGVFIYALGMGTTDGGIIPDPGQNDGRFRDRDGNVVLSQLDEEALKTLCGTTNGYYSQGIGGDFLSKLDRALAEMDRFQEEGKHQRVAKPAHRWFALTGIILLMTSLFIRCLPLQPIMALLAFGLSVSGAKAGRAEDGLAALKNGEPAIAHQYFTEAARKTSGNRATQLHLSAGSAAAQAKDWELAMTSFAEALSSDDPQTQHSAHYGLASALFYSGVPLEKAAKIKAWQGSVDHFMAAIKVRPDHQPSAANLAKVQKLLRELRQNEPAKEPEENKEGGDPPPKEPQENENKEPNPKKDPGSSPPEKPNPDQKKNEEKEPRPGDSDSQKGDGEKPEKDSGDQKPEPGGPSKKEDEDSPNPGELQDDPDAPKDETREERARRLIRQFSDLGAKAPRRIRRPYHRNAQDW